MPQKLPTCFSLSFNLSHLKPPMNEESPPNCTTCLVSKKKNYVSIFTDLTFATLFTLSFPITSATATGYSKIAPSDPKSSDSTWSPEKRTLHSPIDSRWTPLDFTCPSGVQVDSRWICFGREPCQILAKIHLDSRWSPIGLQLDQMDYMDSTPHHTKISAPPGFWWTPHGLHLIFG